MEIRARGSRAVSRRTRKHILLVPRHAAPDQHYFLRQRCPAPSGARQRLLAGIRRHRNRNRQPGSRLFIGRQDRVWPYPVRRGRHNDLWCSTRAQRHRVRWCGGAPRTDWILRGFLCRSDQCIDPASARSGPQRRCDRGSESDFVHWDLSRLGNVLRVYRLCGIGTENSLSAFSRHDARRHHLRHAPVTGLADSAAVVACHKHHLPDSGGWPRERSVKRRRFACVESLVLRRCVVADSLDRSLHPVSHLQRHLRTSIHQTVCQDHSGYSHLFQAAPARNDRSATRGERND